jgi:hypothetical protein
MALKNVGLAIQSASSNAISATAPLRGASSQFKDALTSVPIASVKNMIFLAGVIVLAVIAGVIALQSVMLCRSWCACCVFKSFAWLSVLLTALVFVLAGIFFIIGLPGSDVCFAPRATLNNLVGTREPTGTLSYYLTCDPSSPASGAATTSSTFFINSAKSLLDNAKSGLSAIVVDSSLTPYLSPAFIVASTRLPTRVDAAISAVGLIVTDVVSCKSIGNVFDTLWNGLVSLPEERSRPTFYFPTHLPPPLPFHPAVRRLYHQRHHTGLRSHRGGRAARGSDVAWRGGVLPPPRRRGPLGGRHCGSPRPVHPQDPRPH